MIHEEKMLSKYSSVSGICRRNNKLWLCIVSVKTNHCSEQFNNCIYKRRVNNLNLLQLKNELEIIAHLFSAGSEDGRKCFAPYRDRKTANIKRLPSIKSLALFLKR